MKTTTIGLFLIVISAQLSFAQKLFFRAGNH